MEEFVKVVEQILYMENFNIEITPDLNLIHYIVVMLEWKEVV